MSRHLHLGVGSNHRNAADRKLATLACSENVFAPAEGNVVVFGPAEGNVVVEVYPLVVHLIGHVRRYADKAEVRATPRCPQRAARERQTKQQQAVRSIRVQEARFHVPHKDAVERSDIVGMSVTPFMDRLERLIQSCEHGEHSVRAIVEYRCDQVMARNAGLDDVRHHTLREPTNLSQANPLCDLLTSERAVAQPVVQPQEEIGRIIGRDDLFGHGNYGGSSSMMRATLTLRGGHG